MPLPAGFGLRWLPFSPGTLKRLFPASPQDMSRVRAWLMPGMIWTALAIPQRGTVPGLTPQFYSKC